MLKVEEIAREYRHGLGINELSILNTGLVLNLLFVIVMLSFSLKTFGLTGSDKTKIDSANENIFIIAQCLGIVAGITGLMYTFHLTMIVSKSVPIYRLWIFIPFYLMFLAPYIMAVIYWLSIKRYQRISNWYDEMQLQDIFKSSLLTLILSIPYLLLFVFLKPPSPIYFFLYYFFLILLLFSSGTLYFFKIKDISK